MVAKKKKVKVRRGASTLEGTQQIGARLRELRKARGFSQVEMAARVGVAQTVYSAYETGRVRLHGELILKLAEILRSTANELLGSPGLEPTPAIVLKDKRLRHRLHAIDQLSRRDREAVIRTLDAFLGRAKNAPSGRAA